MSKLRLLPLLLCFFGAFLLFPNSILSNHPSKSFGAKYLDKIQNELMTILHEKLGESINVKKDDSNNFQFMLVPCSGGAGEIGGNVFGDFNYDGLNDQESPIPDIIVNIYSCDANGDNQLVQSTTSDVDGNYTFTGLTDGVRYQIEFIVPDHLPAYQEALLGDNLGAIQYATSPSCDVNVAFTHPQDYCESNPALVATCFINGDPLANGAEAADQDVLVGFNWDDSGTTPLPDHLATAVELGSCYGLGYHRETKKVYTSAFIKRHVGLGPLGIGGIYEIDMSDPNNPVIKQFLDVESIGIDVGNIDSNAGRGLPVILDDPSNDPTAYSKIGREGIGALSVSEDGKIWFMNLFDKKLYSVVIDADNNPNTAPTAGDVESFTLPNPNCSGGTFRPFAVEVFRNEIFVGGVCDGETSQLKSDLSTIIYKKSGNTFSEIANYSLDFDKGWASNADTCENYSGWFAWTDNLPPICATGFYIYPQPIVSEFEFDIDGSIMVGYMDRTGHQLGYRNWPTTGTSPIMTNVSGGDLLRVDNNNGTYVLENNGTAGDLTTGGVGNAQGPGGGEFFFEDIFAGPSDNIPGPPHAETSQGGLAFFRGSGDIMTTALDPYSTLFNSGGVNFLNTSDGTVQNPGYVLYRSSTSSISTFAKANGLGGLTILCPNDPPLSIGKYVWQDDDSDGIQDACEMGLTGINITLFDENGNTLQTTSTNANGYYSFTDLNPNTQYYIVAGTGGQFNTTTFQLNGNLFLTLNDIGDGTNPDKTDSDAQIAGNQANGAFVNLPFVSVLTGEYGFVSNSEDFGFSPDNQNPIAGIGGFVWQDSDEDGIQDGGEGGIEGVTVTLNDNNDQPISSTTSDAFGNYFFPNISVGNYSLTFDETTNTNGITYYLTAPQNQGGDNSLDSDIDPNNNNTGLFSFDPVSGNIEVDAGFYLNVGTIEGFVWNDEDEDGIQDGGESGIEGVTIIIIDNNTQMTIATVVSDVNGNYSLNDIPPGDYIIEFDPDTNTDNIPNLTASPQNQGGDDNLDSDINPNTNQTDVFSFDPENGDLNQDAGFIEGTGSISGLVWEDENEDGLLNNGEVGIEGVSIVLQNAGNDVAIEMVVSDASGAYSFDNIGAGDYYLTFYVITNTAGINDYEITLMDVGNDDSIDSDIDQNTGATDPFTFDPDTGISDLSAGYFISNEMIGGTVWLDSDMDGILDDNEGGVQDVTIILYDENDNILATTQSNSDGSYGFEDVFAGNYYLDFDFTSTPNPNYEFTDQDQGNDDFLDSDVDPNTGQTIVFSFDPTNGNDGSWSAGLTLPFGSVGDFVFHDCNGNGVQDLGEEGIGNVPIFLLQNGVVVNTTNTFSSGYYLFPNVVAGTYTIRFGLPSAFPDYYFVPKDVGGDDQLDSDADPVTGETDPFQVFGGEEFFDVDAGFTSDNESPVFINPPQDENISCNNPQIGDPPSVTVVDNDDQDVDIVYEEVVSNQGGACMGGLTVTRTWTATDDCGNSTVHTQVISAIDNLPPVIVGIPDITVECDSLPGAEGVKAIDDCDQDVELTYSDSLVMDGECMQLILRKWVATDDCGNMTMNLQKITTKDSDHAKIVLTHPLLEDLQWGGSLTLECDSAVTFVVEDAFAMDNCDDDPMLMLMISTEEGDCAADGYFEKITYVWLAEDACGNTSTVAIVVYLTDDTPPIATNIPADITVDCNNIPSVVDPLFEDNCDDDLTIIINESIQGDTCSTYEIIRTWIAEDDCDNVTVIEQLITVEQAELILMGVPDDLTIECIDTPDTAIVFAQNDCFDTELDFSELFIDGICEDTIIRTWIVTDDCGNMISDSQTIILIDTIAPEISFMHPMLMGISDGDLIVFECDSLINFNEDDATAIDNCDDDIEITFMEMPEVGVCEDDGFIVRLECCWKAEDDCGNQSQFCIFVEIVDSTSPTLLNVPDDITIDLSVGEFPPGVPNVTAEDNCDLAINVSFMENQVPGLDGCGYTLTRTWMAEDICGNQVVENQMITAIDKCECDDVLINDFAVTNAECNDSNGSIELVLTGNYDLQLAPNIGNPTANGFDNLPFGSYELTVTDPEFVDCEETLFFDVFQINCKDTLCATITEPIEICIDSALLDYSGVISSALIIQNGNSQTVLATSMDDECIELLPAPNYLGSSPDLICVELCYNGSPNQCDTTYLKVIVEEPPIVCALDLDIQIKDPSCLDNDGEIQVSVAGNVGDLTYNWNPDISQTGQANNLSSGTYDLTVVDDSTGCSIDTSLVLNISGTVDIALGDLNIVQPNCPGELGSVSSNTSIEYEIYKGTIFYGNTPMSNLTEGTYTAVYSLGSCSDSLDFEITEVPDFITSFQSSSESCAGNDGAIILLVDGGNGGYSYNWWPNVSSSNTASGLNASTLYTVTVSDQNGCEYIFQDIFVESSCDTIPCALDLSIENLQPDQCGLGNGVIDLIASGGQGNISYFWNPMVSLTNKAMGLPHGTYEIMAIDTAGCVDSITVVVDSIPSVWELGLLKTDETCAGNDGTIDIIIDTAPDGLVYEWAPDVSDALSAQNLSPGDYSITVTDTLGCFQIGMVTIDEFSKSWSADSEVTPSVCGQANGGIEIVISGQGNGLTYNWSPAVSNSNQAQNLFAGTYSVTVSDDSGCSEILEIEVGNLTQSWSLNQIKTDATCDLENGSIEIEFFGDSSLTFNWLPDVSVTNQANNLAPGTYQVVVVDTLGCFEILDIEIENQGKDWSINTTSNDADCDQDNGSIFLEIVGNTNLNFAWTPNVSTTNEATGLIPGFYQVQVSDSLGCSEGFSFQINGSTKDWSVNETHVDESCDGNDGSIKLQIVDDPGNLTYTWTPNVSSTKEAQNLSAGTYGIVIIDENGCSDSLNIEIFDICDPTLTIETQKLSIDCGDSTAVLCASMDELPGEFAALFIFQQPNNGGLTFENDTCLIYEINPGFEGIDSAAVIVCDDLSFCDTTYFEILVDGCINVTPCADFISEESGIYVTTDCSLDAAICLEYPLDSMLDLTIYDNGDFYFGDVDGCMNDTTLSYSYFAIPGGATSGPYELVSWTVNGSTHSVAFDSIQQLASWMSSWDASANWIVDLNTQSLIGGNPQSSYSALVIEQINTGATANLELNINLAPNGSQIYLPVGSHEVIFVNEDTGCQDTLDVEVHCITPSTIVDTIGVNEMKTTCVDISELPGNLAFNEIICTDCDNGSYNFINDCLNYIGISVGEDLLGVVICDDLGYCDTTWFEIFVEDNQPMPLARIDVDTVQTGTSKIIAVLANDEVNGEMLYQDLVEMPTFGYAELQINGTVTYTSNEDYCGLDAFAYEICNEIGCDTATVNLMIKCPKPIPMTGFSPNHDGVNDGFYVAGIDQYPNNEVIIFNRWGEKVYEKKNYINGEWQGTFENRDLPDGTYFYLIKYGTNGKMSGYVQIER